MFFYIGQATVELKYCCTQVACPMTMMMMIVTSPSINLKMSTNVLAIWVCYSILAVPVDVWDRNLDSESKNVSEAVNHGVENAENDLWSDVEGYSRDYRECIKSGSGQCRRACEEEIEVVQTSCKKRRGGDKEHLKRQTWL